MEDNIYCIRWMIFAGGTKHWNSVGNVIIRMMMMMMMIIIMITMMMIKRMDYIHPCSPSKPESGSFWQNSPLLNYHFRLTSIPHDASIPTKTFNSHCPNLTPNKSTEQPGFNRIPMDSLYQLNPKNSQKVIHLLQLISLLLIVDGFPHIGHQSIGHWIPLKNSPVHPQSFIWNLKMLENPKGISFSR